MVDNLIPAESEPVSEEDTRQRNLVTDLISKENSIVIDFAKSLVTLCISAIGVILALKDKWLHGVSGEQAKSRWLGVSIGLLLIASVISALAMRSSQLRVSLADYSGVEHELSRIAERRHYLTMVSIALIVGAAAIVAVTVL